MVKNRRCRQSDIFANTGDIQAQVLSAVQSKGYLWELSLIVASLGHHTQFTFQKHPNLGPQMTTSEILHRFTHKTLAHTYRRNICMLILYYS